MPCRYASYCRSGVYRLKLNINNNIDRNVTRINLYELLFVYSRTDEDAKVDFEPFDLTIP